MRMTVIVLREAGYEEALLGLSLSYNADQGKMPTRALKQAPLDGGHNKFLESMIVWIDVNAPRYWWSEFDTYRVGMTKQSGSTMHTLKKQPLDQDNFVTNIPQATIDYVNYLIRENATIQEIKAVLPEGFLQRRIVCTNYKTLRNIIQQRSNHRLKEWHLFIDCVKAEVEHPEYLP